MKYTPIDHVGQDAPTRKAPKHWVAWDFGYHSQKAVSTCNTDGVVLRSVKGMTTRQMSRSRAFLGNAEVRGTELLHNGARHLFGHHAARQFIKDPSKLVGKVSDDVTLGGAELPLIYQFLHATLALVLPTPGKYRIGMILALPVATIDGDDDYVQRVSQALVGLHEFTALNGFNADGAPKYGQWEVLIEAVAPREQTLGRLFDIGYDMQGNQLPALDALGTGLTAIVDVGGGTADVSTIMASVDETGELTFERIDEMCSSEDEAGINIMYAYLRENVFAPRGLKVTDVELDTAMLRGSYTDNRPGKGVIDLASDIEKARLMLWQKVLTLLQRTLRLNDAKVSRIICTGGAVGWVEPYLQQQFGAERVVLATDGTQTSKSIMFTQELPLLNIRGWFKALMRKVN